MSISQGHVVKSSHSEVETYLMCPRKHFYRYGHRLQQSGTSDSLALGNAGHFVMETFNRLRIEGVPFLDAAMDALSTLQQAIEDQNPFDSEKLYRVAWPLLSGYFDNYGEEPGTIVESEVLHEVPVTDDYSIRLKIDLLVDIPGRGLVARDYKFTRNFFTTDKVDISPQLPMYYAILTQMGYNVAEVEYDQLRTWATKAAQADPSLLYERTPVPLSAERVYRTMEEHFTVGNQIAKLKRLPLEEWDRKSNRNAWACRECPFTDICAEDLNGGENSELIMSSYYERRPHHDKA